jgi:polyphosphate kinase 2 (PPK2 family)
MNIATGWWFQPTPLKKYDFVSWDDYSQYMEKMFQTTNQTWMNTAPMLDSII